MRAKLNSLPASEYDVMLNQECVDFSRYHPGIRHRQRLLLRLLKQVPHAEIMDVGCGRGELLGFLRSQLGDKVSYRGLDLSPEVVVANNRRFPGATFSQFDLYSPTKSPAPANLVLCCEVIEHLDDPYRGLRNLAPLVSRAGHLILTCPLGTLYPTERHFGHTLHPEHQKLLATAKESGLQLQNMYRWGFPLYSLQKRMTNVNPEWAIKNFANGKYSGTQIAISQVLYLANYINLNNSPWGCQFLGLFKKV